MEFVQQIMGDADIVYQNMLSDTKAAPWSRNISVLDVGIYSQKRDDFYRRLSQEKDAFRAAIKEINTARDERLKHEKQKSLTSGQQKEWEKALNYCNVYDAYVMDGGGFNLSFIKYKKYSEQYLRKLERKFWPQKDD